MVAAGSAPRRPRPSEAISFSSGHDVVGRLLVGMRGHVGAGDAAAQPPRKDDLDAQLVDGLVAAGDARRGVRALATEERALPADRPGAVLVLADHAGAGGEQRLAHEVGVVGRHEADELERVGRGRRQRHDGLQIEQLGDHVGHAAAGLVEARVRGDDGHALARRAQHEPPGLGVVREALERVEDERVVADDDAGAEAPRLVEHRVVHLEGDEHDRRHVRGTRAAALQLVAGRAHLQSHVVPRLREREGREAVDHGDDVTYLHGADTTPVAARRSAVSVARRRRACMYTRRMTESGGKTRHAGPALTAGGATQTAGEPTLTAGGPALGAAGPALHPWLVVLALAPGIVLTLADATVMTITIQAIIRQVGGSVVSVSWVMNGYNLVLTVLFLPMGRLGDRYGHRLVFTLRPRAVHRAPRCRAPWRPSIPTLVAWRVVQAVGAAAVVPTALTLLLRGLPRAAPGLRRRPVRGRQLARARGRPGARRRARLVPGLAGRVLVQPPGRHPRRRPRAHAHEGPAHAAHPRVSRLGRRRAGQRRPLLRHAGDHPGQRLGLGVGRRARPLRRRRRAHPRLGVVGAAHPLSPLRPPPLPRPHLRRRRPRRS